MKIALLQFSAIEGDKDATLKTACTAIDDCKDSDLVILPEIWNIGFMDFDRYKSQAEHLDGPTINCLREKALKKRVHLHTGSFVEQKGDTYFNTSLLFSPEGEILGKYRKIHLFGYESRETEILTPGREVVVADTPFGKMGMATCFDLRFPELFRKMVDQGAHFFLVCSAWPDARHEAWTLLNRTRALENQAFLISANACGISNTIKLAGHSMITDPWGKVLASAEDRQKTLTATIDSREVEKARAQFPGLASRVDFLNPSTAPLPAPLERNPVTMMVYENGGMPFLYYASGGPAGGQPFKKVAKQIGVQYAKRFSTLHLFVQFSKNWPPEANT